MTSITPFGQTGPWRDFASSELTHLAAGGQMACCGYSEEDFPDAPPIAGGGGHVAGVGAVGGPQGGHDLGIDFRNDQA